MQLRSLNIVLIGIFILTLSFSTKQAFGQQTEGDLTKELNDAESVSGGTDFEPEPGPGEAAPPLPTPAPAPQTKISKAPVAPAPVTTSPKAATPAAPLVPSETETPTAEGLPPTTPLPDAADAIPAPAPVPDEQVTPKANYDSFESDNSTSHVTVVPEDEDIVPATPENSNAKKICNCKFKEGISYRERRPAITGLVGIQLGTYSPVNYTPSFNGGSFGDYYGSGGMNIEVIGGFKYNFVLGSIGPQFGAGYYSTSNSSSGATFSVIPITVGLMYELDNIFPEPYVVPYVVGGVYSAIFNEAAGGLTYSGRTAIAEYYAVGALFQLDWIDWESHENNYRDFGIQNTFIYLEARSFLASPDDSDPDLSTPLQISGGFKMEF